VIVFECILPSVSRMNDDDNKASSLPCQNDVYEGTLAFFGASSCPDEITENVVTIHYYYWSLIYKNYGKGNSSSAEEQG